MRNRNCRNMVLMLVLPMLMILKLLMRVLTLLLCSHGSHLSRTLITSIPSFFSPPYSPFIQHSRRACIIPISIVVAAVVTTTVSAVAPAAIRIPAALIVIVAFINLILTSRADIAVIRALQV